MADRSQALVVPTPRQAVLPAPRVLQRKCACEESGTLCERCAAKKKLQRHASHGAGPTPAIPPIVDQVLASPGHALDAGTRAFMEPRLGFDFSGVRVHSDAHARRSADAVNANAYTVGHHIVLGRDVESRSQAGRRLMAHELAHVVQQSRGGVASGIDGDPMLERAADRVASTVAQGRPVDHVSGASGVGIARDAKLGAPPPEVFYEVDLPEGKKRVTAAELEAMKQRSAQRLRLDLARVANLAEVGRQSQIDMLKDYHGGVESLSDVLRKPKALIGIAADIKAGVTPPYIGMWTHPKRMVEQGLAALESGNLAHAARLLSAADRDYRDCMHQWNAYREATIGGAEGVASNLETVRDVSFAIALVAAAVVAAPVIAAAIPVAGVGGTALTALGTAGVTGVLGVGLGGGSAAGGSYAATGKVDWKEARAQGERFGKQGAVTGLTAGLGSAIGAGGQAAQLARPLAQQAARRCLTEAGINVTGEITTATLDHLAPPTPKPSAGEPPPPHKSPVAGVLRATVAGCIGGAVGAPIGRLAPGAARTAADVTVGAGVGYADARASGMTHEEALAAAAQGTLTSSAVSRAHAGTGQHPPPAGAPATHEEPRSPGADRSQAPPAGPRAPHAAPPAIDAPLPAAHAGAHTPSPGAVKPREPAPAAHPPERSAQPRKATQTDDTAPAIRKEDAIAQRPLDEGHAVVATKDGVGRCSPTPCPVIHIEYAKELKAQPELKAWNDKIQKLRKTNPEEAVRQGEALVRSLEAQRHNAARQAGAPRTKVDDTVDRAFDEATSRKAGKTAGTTAPKEHPTAQDISLNIDEILPVGERGASIGERRSRATDLNVREFKDALTNQRTKHARTDPRDVERLKTVRDPVSLAMTETTPTGKTVAKTGNEFNAIWERRFSEITELKTIGERALNDMKGKGTRRPGDLKEELNSRIWDEIKSGSSTEGRIVAEAIQRSGFDTVTAPNGNTVLRALTAGELHARGLTFTEGQGWIKAGGSQ